MQVISTLGRETINTPLYVQIDMTQCHIMTEMLCRYALVGEPHMGGKATKVRVLSVLVKKLFEGKKKKRYSVGLLLQVSNSIFMLKTDDQTGLFEPLF